MGRAYGENYRLSGNVLQQITGDSQNRGLPLL
jgi:hypothetical protein